MSRRHAATAPLLVLALAAVSGCTAARGEPRSATPSSTRPVTSPAATSTGTTAGYTFELPPSVTWTLQSDRATATGARIRQWRYQPSPSANGSDNAGTKYVRSFTLDLHDPANLAAFHRAFVTSGSVALPRPALNPTDSSTFGLLVSRIVQDAVYVQSEYAATDSGGSASAKRGAFGVEGTEKGTGTKLKEALVQDFRMPDSQLAPLATCGK